MPSSLLRRIRRQLNAGRESHGRRHPPERPQFVVEALEQRSLLAVEAISVIEPSQGTYTSNGYSWDASVSDDGRYTVFQSYADDLVSGDLNGQPDVFVYDRLDRTTRLVSVDRTGSRSANAGSFYPVISGNGRFVAFSGSASDAVDLPVSGHSVFVRDIETGVTQLVDVNRNGTGSGNGNSFVARESAISADGRYIAFMSQSSDLVANDDNGAADVFVRDLVLGTTTLVSVSLGGATPGDQNSGGYDGAVISPDGRFVAFHSDARNLVLNPGPAAQVYVRDLVAGRTMLASVNRTGEQGGNNFSNSPVLSPDGRFVVFQSRADDLVADDRNAAPDLFLRDLVANTTRRIARDPAGLGDGSGWLLYPRFSADSRLVVFDSEDSTHAPPKELPEGGTL